MNYPYIPADSSHTGGDNGAVTRIVIHATCSATKNGGARNNAAYFQTKQAGGAAHYVVDPSEVIQCIHENVIGYHAPPNKGSIGIELCDPQTGAASRWASPDDESMLKLAAKLVVEIAGRTGVPLVQLSTADVKAGKHGICGHVNVSEAFRQSDHSDPGTDFPWAHFMALVAAAAHPAAAKQAKTYPTLKYGTGSVEHPSSDVHNMQKLIGLNPDGVYTLKVEAVVKNWQKAHGLTADGVAGPATLKAMGW